MRPIDNQQLRRFANLATLQASNKAIAVETHKNRKKFIDDHEA